MMFMIVYTMNAKYGMSEVCLRTAKFTFRIPNILQTLHLRVSREATSFFEVVH